MAAKRRRGFTLIELMIALAVVTLLAAIALPTYNSHITRSRVPAGLQALSSHAMRMEQGFQDTGTYGNAGCRLAVPVAANFTLHCNLTGNGSGFTTIATGNGVLDGYVYSIDHNDTHRTLAHPNGLPGSDCWTIKGSTCDS